MGNNNQYSDDYTGDIGAYQKRHKKLRALMIALSAAGVIAAATATYILMNPAQTMTKDGIDEMDPNEDFVVVDDASSLEDAIPAEEPVQEAAENYDDVPLFEEAEGDGSIPADAMASDEEDAVMPGGSSQNPGIVLSEEETELEPEAAAGEAPAALAQAAAGAAAAQPGTAAPQEVQSEKTVPQAQPETAAPEEAEPEAAQPETAAPEEAEPEAAVSEAAQPETAAPEEAEPEAAVSEAAQPETETSEEEQSEEKLSETVQSEKTEESDTSLVGEKAAEPATESPEDEAVETEVSAAKAQETEAAETEVSAAKVPDTETADTEEDKTEAIDAAAQETETEAEIKGTSKPTVQEDEDTQTSETEAVDAAETETEETGPQKEESQTEFLEETETEEESEEEESETQAAAIREKSKDEVNVETEGEPLKEEWIDSVGLEIKTDDGWENVQADDKDKIEVDADQMLRFQVTYTIDPGTLSEGMRTLIYQIPKEITRVEESYGEIVDADENVIADYAIDTNGVIHVTFTDEIAKLNEAGTKVSCRIEFCTKASNLR